MSALLFPPSGGGSGGGSASSQWETLWEYDPRGGSSVWVTGGSIVNASRSIGTPATLFGQFSTAGGSPAEIRETSAGLQIRLGGGSGGLAAVGIGCDLAALTPSIEQRRVANIVEVVSDNKGRRSGYGGLMVTDTNFFRWSFSYVLSLGGDAMPAAQWRNGGTFQSFNNSGVSDIVTVLGLRLDHTMLAQSLYSVDAITALPLPSEMLPNAPSTGPQSWHHPVALQSAPQRTTPPSDVDTGVGGDQFRLYVGDRAGREVVFGRMIVLAERQA
ncbi:MAG: hypothetical protein AAFV53_29640, partial [Myxococcota bacterium]